MYDDFKKYFNLFNLRPRGKGRELAWQGAWQGAWHENTLILRIRMLPNLLPVATCRRCPQGGFSHGQTACEPASRRLGVANCEVSRDWRFQPPNTLLKQEELQLRVRDPVAEASFHDKNIECRCCHGLHHIA